MAKKLKIIAVSVLALTSLQQDIYPDDLAPQAGSADQTNQVTGNRLTPEQKAKVKSAFQQIADKIKNKVKIQAMLQDQIDEDAEFDQALKDAGLEDDLKAVMQDEQTAAQADNKNNSNNQTPQDIIIQSAENNKNIDTAAPIPTLSMTKKEESTQPTPAGPPTPPAEHPQAVAIPAPAPQAVVTPVQKPGDATVPTLTMTKKEESTQPTPPSSPTPPAEHPQAVAIPAPAPQAVVAPVQKQAPLAAPTSSATATPLAGHDAKTEPAVSAQTSIANPSAPIIAEMKPSQVATPVVQPVSMAQLAPTVQSSEKVKIVKVYPIYDATRAAIHRVYEASQDMIHYMYNLLTAPSRTPKKEEKVNLTSQQVSKAEETKAPSPEVKTSVSSTPAVTVEPKMPAVEAQSPMPATPAPSVEPKVPVVEVKAPTPAAPPTHTIEAKVPVVEIKAPTPAAPQTPAIEAKIENKLEAHPLESHPVVTP